MNAGFHYWPIREFGERSDGITDSGHNSFQIYSKRSEQSKLPAKRKPTAPLALTSSEWRDKGTFGARLPTAFRPSRLVQERFFIHQKKFALLRRAGDRPLRLERRLVFEESFHETTERDHPTTS